MQLFERVTVPSPKTKTETETRGIQDQDQDQDSEVPRRRPRPRLEGSKTKTETKTCKNESRDVSRPRLKSRELQVCYVVHFFLLEMEYSGAFVGHMHSAAYHVFYSCHEFTLFDVFSIFWTFFYMKVKVGTCGKWYGRGWCESKFGKTERDRIVTNLRWPSQLVGNQDISPPWMNVPFLATKT